MASAAIVNDIVSIFTELDVQVRDLATSRTELVIARLDSWSGPGVSVPAPRATGMCRVAPAAA